MCLLASAENGEVMPGLAYLKMWSQNLGPYPSNPLNLIWGKKRDELSGSQIRLVGQ